MEHPHILVVDDEPQITRVLRTTLTAKGYEIRVANDGEMALEIMKDWSPNLVITDLMMPNMDGVQLCKRIRTMSEVPIIVLSVRGEERNKIQALDAGADDYITKPFSSGELQARVRAALRRSPQSSQTTSREFLDLGDFHIDFATRQVKVRSNDVRLTPKEFDLLSYLAEHPRRVITHRTLLGAIWGELYTEQPEYLRVFVGQLRKKIEINPAEPRYLLTDRWVGYRFEPGPLEPASSAGSAVVEPSE
ncbi:MAG: response regulator transcription factor [Candidatus Korobacteraceae bacterium]